MKTLTIIDTFGFFFRSYFALPPLRNAEGFPTGLLTGFVNFVDTLRREHATDYLVFALDAKGRTFRNDLYPEYKAHREAAPDDLIKQLPIAIEWIEKMGFANLSQEGYEADDIIATVTKLAKEKGIKVRIVSHDKDLYQMIEDAQVEMYDSVKKKVIDTQGCIDKFGVHPRDFINFQAILGDSSDNVPGIKGIGQKGASTLINTYHTLEAIYENIEHTGTPRMQQLLLEGKENAFLSRQLVTMSTDVYASLDVESFVFEDKNYLACLLEEFEHYEMRQAIQKAKSGIDTPADQEKTIAKVITPALTFTPVTLQTKEKLMEVIEKIDKDAMIAFDTETTSLDTKTAKMVGFSFCYEPTTSYYVPMAHSYLGVGDQVSIEDAREALEALLSRKVIGQNLKFDLSLLYHYFQIEPIEPFGDTMIMAWLLDPSSRVGLDELAKRFFRYEMKPFKAMVKKDEDFSAVAIEDATFYAAEDAWMTYLLYGALETKIKLASLGHLVDEAKQVEYPFINVLIGMESLGIKVDPEKLRALQKK
ncbi:MAG: polymerase, partial [Pseudomonadota bacterium]